MAKKGLGKGLGAIFGEDVVKESKEELEKAKAKRAAAAEEIDEKGRILMLKLDLISRIRNSRGKHLTKNRSMSWRGLLNSMEFFSLFWYRSQAAFMRSLQGSADGALQKQLD